MLADGLMPETILVSPFKRTQQTADHLIETLGFSGTRESDEMFVHFADHELAASYLDAHPATQLMVVSHMPIVARMSRYLDPNCGIDGFQTAQIVRFQRVGNSLKMDKIYLPE